MFAKVQRFVESTKICGIHKHFWYTIHVFTLNVTVFTLVSKIDVATIQI